MKYVQFIKRLIVEEIPMLNRDEIQYQVLHSMTPLAPEGDQVLLMDSAVETMVVPVHWLCRKHTDYKTRKSYRTDT